MALPVVGLVLGIVAIYGYTAGWFKGSASSGSIMPGTTAPAAPSANTPGGTAGTAASAPASSASATAPAPNSPPMQKFSDEERQNLLALPPQQQAEQMMMAAVNHYEGATDMVMGRVAGWRGQIKKTANWDTVELEARYSSDLRVRNAAIEVDLAINNLDSSAQTADRLMSDARTNVGNRGYDFYMLGMLANRGVQRDSIHATLRDWAHDADEGTRFWAIEGLAFLGTDDTIPDFLEVLRSDPSMNVRQRCGASLAKSGMLTRVQRMNAVPGLMDIAADSAQDATTQGWAFEALRQITNEQIGNDAGAWRNWYDAHGKEKLEQFRAMDQNWVLGNS